MSALETSLIDRYEYMLFEEDRLQGDEITVNGIYVAMFSLNRLVEGKGALKRPARVTKLQKVELGTNEPKPKKPLYIGKIVLLGGSGSTQQASKELHLCVGDGYWINVKTSIELEDYDNDGELLAMSAYLRGPRETSHDNSMQALESKRLPEPHLAIAA